MSVRDPGRRLATGQSVSKYLGTAAAVVCQPPFDRPQWPSVELTTDPRWEFGIPAPRDGELAWVQHCYAHLRPRGVAVVAVSPRTCFQPSGEHIRGALVRSGALRDVIALPKGMSSCRTPKCTSGSCSVPGARPDHAAVRIVDLRVWATRPTSRMSSPRGSGCSGDTDPTSPAPSPPGTARQRAQSPAFPLRQARGPRRAPMTWPLSPPGWSRSTRASAGACRIRGPETGPALAYVTLGEPNAPGALTIQSRDATPRLG